MHLDDCKTFVVFHYLSSRLYATGYDFGTPLPSALIDNTRSYTIFESRASISGEGVRMFLGRRNVSTYSVLQTESIDFYHHFLKRVFMRLPQEKTAV